MMHDQKNIKFIECVKELDKQFEKPTKHSQSHFQFSPRLDSFNSHFICRMTCISGLMSVDFPAVYMYSPC